MNNRHYLTEQKPQYPLAEQLIDQPGHHDGQPEQEVSGRQGRDEQVGRTLEVGVGADAHDDEAVAEDGDERDEGQQAGLKLQKKKKEKWRYRENSESI